MKFFNEIIEKMSENGVKGRVLCDLRSPCFLISERIGCKNVTFFLHNIINDSQEISESEVKGRVFLRLAVALDEWERGEKQT